MYITHDISTFLINVNQTFYTFSNNLDASSVLKITPHSHNHNKDFLPGYCSTQPSPSAENKHLDSAHPLFKPSLCVQITPMESKPGMSQLELVSMDSEEDVLNDNRLPKAEAELLLVVKAGEVDDLFEHLRVSTMIYTNRSSLYLVSRFY